MIKIKRKGGKEMSFDKSQEFTGKDFIAYCRSKKIKNLKCLYPYKIKKLGQDEKSPIVYLDIDKEETLDRLKSYDIRVYLWQHASILGAWLDIDLKDEVEVYNLSLLFPRPTFIIETGRHFAFLWDVENDESEDGLWTENEYNEMRNLLCKILEQKYTNLAKENRSKTISNALIRPPGSWNSKSNTQVRWFKIGDKYTKSKFLEDLIFLIPQGEKKGKSIEDTSFITTTSPIPPLPPSPCGLINFLWDNFYDLKYDGWRLLSYDAILRKKENEFLEKSKEWEKIHPDKVQQRPQYRLNYSAQELMTNSDDFSSCKTIAELTEDMISEKFLHTIKLNFHPCDACPHRLSYRKPYKQQSKFSIPEGYEINENYDIKYKNELLAKNFNIDSILIKRDSHYDKCIIVVRTGKSELAYVDFASNQELISQFRVSSVPRFRRFFAEFESLNPHLVVRDWGFSGYHPQEKIWSILNLHYNTPKISPTFDVSCEGKVEDWIAILRDLVSIMTENKDFFLAIPLAGGLNFLAPYQNTIAPAYLIEGQPETGKTLRGLLINFLIREPKMVDFSSLTRAFIQNELVKIKAFICIDEFKYEDRNSIEHLIALLNMSEKYTASRFYQSTYAPLILFSNTVKILDEASARRIFHMKIPEPFLIEEYSSLYNEILKRKCWGHLYKITEDLKKLKETLKLPFEIPRYYFAFYNHYLAVKSALEWWYVLCKFFDLKYITKEDVISFLQENVPIRKEVVILHILEFIHQKFTKDKRRSVYWKEIAELGYNEDIYKLILCDEWFYTKNSSGKIYPRGRITETSHLYFLWLNGTSLISKNDFLQKIKETRKKIEKETDYKFKVDEKELEMLVDLIYEIPSQATSILKVKTVYNEKHEKYIKQPEDEQEQDVIYFD
jgi:hypothetical protein